ncbi:MAG: tRNA1(Val) (adenine(37)-N6)-methyltransferase [Acutalibacteraceae bacterium]
MAWSLENLGNDVSLYISEEHGFGTDALLLADFAAPHRRDRCIDLGTGCGIIPMLWYRNGVTEDLYGLDLQASAIEQFSRSLEINGNPSSVHALQGDLRELPPDLPFGTFRVVTMNPPYKRMAAGILSRAASDQIARHETECKLEDIMAAAAKLLTYGGRFCLCNRPERLADVIVAMRGAGLEPKRLRFVQKRPETRPWLFLLEGRLYGKPFLDVLPPFYIQNESGGDSDELLRVLGCYRKENSHGKA